MNLKQIVDLINTLEKTVDVDEFSFQRFNYWPFIRQYIWGKLTTQEYNHRREGVDLAGFAARPSGALDPFQCRVAATEYGKPLIWETVGSSLSQSLPCDMLFFTRAEEHKEIVNGHSYAKVLDSLAEYADEKYNVAKIELLSPQAKIKRHRPPFYIDNKEFLVGKRISDIRVPAYDTLQRLLAGKGLSIERETLANSLVRISRARDLFKQVLAIFEPKVVFMSCYYYPIGMGLAAAAHELGITSVDVQHGRLGPDHGMYTDFSYVPHGGFEIVPDRIWCWSEEARGWLERGRENSLPHHGPLVGGNAWLAKWINGSGYPIDHIDETRFQVTVDGRFPILVSLQNCSYPMPEHLLVAMEKSPADWVWLIRLHPLQNDMVGSIEQALVERNLVNYEIELSTSLPLYWLLKCVKHHVTLFSSVALEAHLFSIPTTLIDPVGENIYKKYVSCGDFTVALDHVELLNQINIIREKAQRLKSPAAIVYEPETIFSGFVESVAIKN